MFFYRLIINLIFFLSPIIILFRFFKNKENFRSILEKFSLSKIKRKNGKLVWFHCCSVGELLSIMPLIERMEKNKNINQVLLTTSTLSSSKVFKNFKLKKTFHQFFPFDVNFISNKFLSKWKPDTVFFIESEVWPNMIINIKKKKIPLILLNARITKKSFYNWKRFIFFSRQIFSNFDLCLTQNSETKNYLKKLGAKKIKKIGNLKFSETKELNKFSIEKKQKKFFRNKKILFCASSTHGIEETFCGKIFIFLKKIYNNGVLIIIPRHVERCEKIKNDLEKMKLKVHLHSEKKSIDLKNDIYLVDTYGETKKFLKISNIVFLGGSLIKRGGQNPLEAVHFGANVLHGPNVENFKEVYSLLEKLKISFKINNINRAKKIIINILSKKSSKFSISKKIKSIGHTILNQNIKEIKKFI